MNERRVGSVPVDTATLLILDPTYLVGDDERERVFAAALDRSAGPVWLAEPPAGRSDPPKGETAEAVVVKTRHDGTFPVYVTYDDEGYVTSVRVDLRPHGY